MSDVQDIWYVTPVGLMAHRLRATALNYLEGKNAREPQVSTVGTNVRI